ncbi:hypothetical protein AJ85_19715 [Alkalihalobacillus alcalophilus ATCC 27647 = CGMCC 1.3604]|uniref:Uncharacterized protein n=1 Tax=Alkalihalobacillus alcalophilus ATCC 27647 = CGMCC 1.3604 TaxID=1218173 RepID=A0A094WH73_ALKAL|nr:hypothetical protein [Alkalihalobacillus alcalophilus]KGA97134.1 hypothetical protein BALCAV_0211975 [Alkalihalobacillus alcalophilus ATCC 27647 = CGMCC 1.3604]MED1560594.1 hypothetical protein [Alkalihalobacillus alcalophilus]THG89069.1 hypothetical protein AJ85_19715 [Alkalihalobacillus alcalophilus ATCC 27647 = CGMCC 1.3604]
MAILARMITIMLSSILFSTVVAFIHYIPVSQQQEGGDYWSFFDLVYFNLQSSILIFTAVALIIYFFDRQLKKIEPIKRSARTIIHLVGGFLFAIGFLLLLDSVGVASWMTLILIAGAVSVLHYLFLRGTNKLLLGVKKSKKSCSK